MSNNTNTDTAMEKTEKQFYESPQVEVVQLVPEGIICESTNQSRRFDYDYEEW
jgi:hypothetical protein